MYLTLVLMEKLGAIGILWYSFCKADAPNLSYLIKYFHQNTFKVNIPKILSMSPF